MDSSSIFDQFRNLIINSVENQCSPSQYFIFYNEFFNEKFGIALKKTEPDTSASEAQANPISVIKHETFAQGDIVSMKAATPPPIDDEQKKKIYEILSDCFIQTLRELSTRSEHFVTVTNYLIQVCFKDYNSSFVNYITQKIFQLGTENEAVIIYFFTKATNYFKSLNDQLIIDDFLVNDVPAFLLPNLVSNIGKMKSRQLFVSLGKLLISILSKYDLKENPKFQLKDQHFYENVMSFCDSLSETSLVLSKNFYTLFDSKFETAELKKSQKHDDKSPFTIPVETPSITSPLPSALSGTSASTKQGSISQQAPNTKQFYDVKLVRYYKNMWLNNKIQHCTTDEIDFFPKYQSIENTLNSNNSIPSFESAIVDFIDTSFTCFAQFLNNKKYHQSANSNFTLLEKKWYLFIVKRIPLIVEKYCGVNRSYLAVKAVQDLDDKIIKVFRSYYATDRSNSADNDSTDLFDNFDSPSQPELDIRHDFLKSLCMMKLQNPSVLNKVFSNGDEMIDTNTITDHDLVLIRNKQNNFETIHNLKEYVESSFDSFDFESLCFHDTCISDKSECFDIIYMLQNFESIAPTSQLIIAGTLISILETAVKNFDYKLVAKICALLSFNLGDSMPGMFTMVNCDRFVIPLIKFLDESWDENKEQVFSTGEGNENDSDVESFNDYIYFGFALVFLIYLQEQYKVDVVQILVKITNVKKLESSFLLQYLQTYKISCKEFKLPSTKEPYKAAKLLQDWTNSLFVENSISDELIKNADIKDLAFLIPFMFDQVISVFQGLVTTSKQQQPQNKNELNAALTNFNRIVVNSVEYFSQPFMMIGLVKIVFTLDSTIKKLQSICISQDESLLDTFLNILTPLFNESGILSSESKVLQFILYRVTGPKLLLTMKNLKRLKAKELTENSATVNTKLDYLISRLDRICDGANMYDFNPSILELDSNESSPYENQDLSPKSSGTLARPPVYFDFEITSDAPMNKIMHKQCNSFWNLHSSTFYNYDYLQKVIQLLGPGKFFTDIHRTLVFKVETNGIPTMGNTLKKGDKPEDDVDVAMQYLIYFSILFDFSNNNERLQILQFLESPLSSSFGENLESKGTTTTGPKETKTENDTAKTSEETANDNDFNMLFGEDSTDNIDDVLMSDSSTKDEETALTASDAAEKIAKFSFLKKNTFAYLFFRYHETKAYPFEAFEEFYKRYLDLLKRCII
ncbi:hypothetical protein ACO0QE_001240 [Hanseniaspora vineae]